MNKSKLNRNILKLTISSALSTVLFTSTVFAGVGTVSVDYGTLNVRDTASTSSDVVTKLDKGSSVDVVGEESGFYIINFDGTNRYVSKDFITISETDGVVTGNDVRVRSNSSTNGNVLGTVNAGETFTVLAKAGDWYKISYNGDDGYVLGSYIDVEFSEGLENEGSSSNETTYGIVLGSAVNFREDASTDSGITTVLGKNSVVDVISTEEDGWVQVEHQGNEGYVSSDFLKVEYGVKPAYTSSNSSKGQEIVSYAKNYLGTRYVWGGTSLGSGVDCSGFTYAVYRDFGYSLNRIASDQYRNGTRVSKSNLQAGDLVFFDTSGGNNGQISHVGIYCGDGNFIHSSSSKASVIISSLSSSYYQGAYVGATRIVN
ncbi:MAG: SH3 domain-containing protein [Lachnospirales bacterium]